MTSCSATTERCCTSPTGPNRQCWPSIPRACASSPQFRSASIRIKWCCIRTTTASSSPARRATRVAVIDTKRGMVTETIRTSLFPRAPEGSTPDALALAPDGKTLYVANADNNCVAVVDIADPEREPGQRLHSDRLVSHRRRRHAGRQESARRRRQRATDQAESRSTERTSKPTTERPGHAVLPFPYIGTTLHGALSIVPIPDGKGAGRLHGGCLPQLSVFRQTAHRRRRIRRRRRFRRKSANRRRSSTSSTSSRRTAPTIRCSATSRRATAIRALVMFGEKVTPNHHKLAEEFVLLDNLYCNGQVSRDGHPWSTMAYHTDYIARDWHLTYSKRKGVDDDDDNGDLSNALPATLWDACARAGLSYRSYGEYGKRVSTGDGAAQNGGPRARSCRPHVPRLRRRQGQGRQDARHG